MQTLNLVLQYVVPVLVTAVLAPLILDMRKQSSDHKKEHKALEDKIDLYREEAINAATQNYAAIVGAVRSIMLGDLERIYMHCVREGKTTALSKKHANTIYEQYQKPPISGNSYGSELIEYINQTSVQEGER
jgi:hypothetical protein